MGLVDDGELGRADLEVVDVELALGHLVEDAHGGPASRREAVRRMVLRRAQGPAEDDGPASLVGIEVAVAAGQGEPVGLAHGLGADDVDPQAQVAAQLTDQHELLVVLLAEHGDVGPDQPEELGDDGQDPAEVTWPQGSLELVAERPRLHRHDRVAAGVDLLDPRREDDVHAFALGRSRDRPRGCAGIGRGPRRRRTAGGSRRRWRPRALADPLASRAEQARVTFVQGTHRGHHADG